MASLKLKKRDYGSEPDKKKLVIAGVRHQLLLLLRRRHRLFPLVSAVSGCLLLLLFSHSFLSPPPPLIHRTHIRVRFTFHSSPSLIIKIGISLVISLCFQRNNQVALEPNSDPTTPFRVPVRKLIPFVGVLVPTLTKSFLWFLRPDHQINHCVCLRIMAEDRIATYGALDCLASTMAAAMPLTPFKV